MASLRSFRPLLTRAYAPRVSLARPLLSSDMRMSLRRNYASTSNQQAPKQGSNPLLWIGCISLGVAYTYYEKKQKEKLAPVKDDNKNKTDDSKSTGDTSKQAIVDSKSTGVTYKQEPVKDDTEKKTDDSKSTEDTSKQAVVDSKSTGVTSKQEPIASKSKNIDYQQVYNDIAELLDSNPDYDDGSYGPVLLRLAWHSSGTYNKEDHSGGSSGGTMRFRPEASHAANNGLEVARDLLEKKIKPKYPEISYGDMYTLGGVVAIQELGGPTIKWRPGRKDQGENKCTPDGRLPDGAKLADHVRDIFYRMGFNDQEIVALTGAHVLGRCHLDRSGFDGPWQEAPTFFSNEYFKAITSREWVKRDLPNGSWQWVDKANREVMMLPIEIAMLEDKELKPYFELYAKDMGRFYDDFAAAFKKLIELGVEFNGDEKEYEFERANI